jgi:periplasmic divalent cation tolerance protein
MRSAIVFVGENLTYVVVFVTAGSKQEATKIVRVLLEEKLIVCGNIIENISSLFWWQNKIEEENEVLVIMKSEQGLFKKLTKKVLELHSYDVPEVLALPVVDGSQAYLDWMKANFESVSQ